MKLMFTDAALRAIRPTDRQLNYWDTLERGFGLRVSRGGTKTFFIYYRHRGVPRRYDIGQFGRLKLSKARLAARIKLGEVANGSDPAGVRAAERNADTFKSLAAAYIEHHAKKNKRSWREDERMIGKDLLPAWGGTRKAVQISRRDVRQLLLRVVARDAPIGANRILSLARRIFNFGIDEELLDVNPCWRVKMPAPARSRQRVLTTAEIGTVWAALEEETPSICSILRLQLLTAQRVGEIRQMRYEDIDQNTLWWTVPEVFAKNKKSHRVPLTATAVAILQRHPQTPGSPWVFPGVRNGLKPFDYQTIYKAVRKIRRIHKIADWGTHDLRRTVASSLTGAGVSQTTAMRILNHSERGATQTYNRHSYDPEKRSALDFWDRKLNAIIDNSDQSDNVLMFTRS